MLRIMMTKFAFSEWPSSTSYKKMRLSSPSGRNADNDTWKKTTPIGVWGGGGLLEGEAIVDIGWLEPARRRGRRRRGEEEEEESVKWMKKHLSLDQNTNAVWWYTTTN